MFKKVAAISLFLFLPTNIALGSDNRLLDGFDEWQEERALKEMAQGDAVPLSFDEWRVERDRQSLTQPNNKQVSDHSEYSLLSPQIKAQNQVIDEFIKMFITGSFLALLAGFVGLISWAYAKATGKRAEVERDEKSNIEVASRMRRMANFSIDCLILINGISALIAYSAISFEWYGLFEYSWFIWIGTILLYYIFFEGLFGRTPGKLVTRTKVIGKSGEKPNLSEVIGRSLVRLVPFEIFSYMGKRALGWHDRWSGTMVVPTTPNESADKVGTQKESTWHLRLTNIVIFLIAPIFWVIVFIADSGDIEEVPILLLLIASTGLAVWVVYKATLYVIYGSKK